MSCATDSGHADYSDADAVSTAERHRINRTGECADVGRLPEPGCGRATRCKLPTPVTGHSVATQTVETAGWVPGRSQWVRADSGVRKKGRLIEPAFPVQHFVRSGARTPSRTRCTATYHPTDQQTVGRLSLPQFELRGDHNHCLIEWRDTARGSWVLVTAGRWLLRVKPHHLFPPRATIGGRSTADREGFVTACQVGRVLTSTIESTDSAVPSPPCRVRPLPRPILLLSGCESDHRPPIDVQLLIHPSTSV